MRDPYDVLNVPRTASDDEVKSAYRDLARKYHPDNFANSDNPTVSEMFEEKMKEINEAYDTIMTNRRNGTDSARNYSSSSSSGYSGGSQQQRQQSSTQNNSYNNTYANKNPYSSQGAASAGAYAGAGATYTDFADVRQLLNTNKYNEAEELLEGVPMMRRNAEWYFLRGAVLYHRGWIEQAYEHFSQAVQLDPMNAEYRAAFNTISNQRSGKRGGYVYDTDRAERGCNPLSMCCSLFCADSCCECFGGDMISCC